jgi:hypothetical protein
MMPPPDATVSPMQWNNHGVLTLEIGRADEAKGLFMKALETLGVQDGRIINRYSPPTTASNEETNNEHNNPRAPSPSPTQNAITGWSMPLLQQEEDSCFVDGVFVYCRALYVHPTFRDSFCESYAAAIQFNLGLTYHILAMTAGDATSKSEAYRESYMFYEYAMDTLLLMLPAESSTESSPQAHAQQAHAQQQTREGNSIEMSSSILPQKEILQTVIFNNSGQIFYCTFMNMEAATECFTAACGLVMADHCAAAAQQQNHAAALDEMDVTCLLQNLHMCLPSLNAAASA